MHAKILQSTGMYSNIELSFDFTDDMPKDDILELLSGWQKRLENQFSEKSILAQRIKVKNETEAKIEANQDNPEKASTKQLNYIRRLVESTGSDIFEIVKYYEAKALPELTVEQATECIDFLKKKEKKE